MYFRKKKKKKKKAAPVQARKAAHHDIVTGEDEDDAADCSRIDADAGSLLAKGPPLMCPAHNIRPWQDIVEYKGSFGPEQEVGHVWLEGERVGGGECLKRKER